MKDKKYQTKINFKKAVGLIIRNTKNIDTHKYCIDVMQQNLAAIGLLQSAHQMLMKDHLDNCFRKIVEIKNEKRRRQMLMEILGVTKEYRRTIL